MAWYLRAMRRLLLVSGLFGGLSAGISACESDSVCTPGKVDPCFCPGGEVGGQACNAMGTGFEECLCDGTTSGDGDGDGDVGGTSGGDGDPTSGDGDGDGDGDSATTGDPTTGDPTTGDPTTGDPTTSGDGDGDGDLELRNDSFTGNGQAVFQGGFIVNECWGSIYEVPAEVTEFGISRGVALVGGDSINAAFDVFVYGLTENATNPQNGVQLFQEGFDLVGTDTAYNEVAINLAGPFSYPRLSLIFCHLVHDGYPSISRDTDGWVPGANFIKASGTWVEASTFGVAGDWINRLVITPL